MVYWPGCWGLRRMCRTRGTWRAWSQIFRRISRGRRANLGKVVSAEVWLVMVEEVFGVKGAARGSRLEFERVELLIAM